jgi:phosphoribosyl 1,2-cyclic phosphodiesterase
MPSVTLCNFASGSSGNCTYLATESTRLLIDAGISAKRIRAHLQEVGVDFPDVNGVCVTHEHGDHISALPQLNGRHDIPLYGNAGTVQSLAHKEKFRDLKWKIFTNGQPFEIGDFTLYPYSIPHDAYDPVGFVIEAHGIRVGFATDIGLPTRLIRHQLKGCHALVLETNHDRILLDESERPWSLKQRIAGRQGHMSNEEAADLLKDIAGPELQRIYLAHLSEDCNQPELAESCIRMTLKAMQRTDVEIHVAAAKTPSALWVCEALTGG